MARWILGEYALRPDGRSTLSAGVSHQLPELYQVRGGFRLARPAARARDATSMSRSSSAWGRSVRWQATLFNRDESDILREPDIYPRLVGGVIVDPPVPGRYANSLSGSSRGIELLVNRQSTAGLSGWVAYSYGKTRYADADRGETFWADFDRRHALNIFGTYRFSTRTDRRSHLPRRQRLPDSGLLGARDGILFVADRPNQVRLPPYARLDVRASRAFETLRAAPDAVLRSGERVEPRQHRPRARRDQAVDRRSRRIHRHPPAAPRLCRASRPVLNLRRLEARDDSVAQLPA